MSKHETNAKFKRLKRIDGQSLGGEAAGLFEVRVRWSGLLLLVQGVLGWVARMVFAVWQYTRLGK